MVTSEVFEVRVAQPGSRRTRNAILGVVLICVGHLKAVEPTGIEAAPIDGVWFAWSAGTCTKTVAKGAMRRGSLGTIVSL